MNAIIFGIKCPGLVGCLTCPRGSSPVPLVRESGLGLLWSFPCPGGRSTVRLVRQCSRIGVAVALKRAIFVVAEDTLPMATLFVGGMSQKVTVTA